MILIVFIFEFDGIFCAFKRFKKHKRIRETIINRYGFSVFTKISSFKFITYSKNQFKSTGQIMEQNVLKGTTTVGVICTDGIVLASERRATMGHFIASREAKKVYQIGDTIGLTIAGSVGDAQQIVRAMTVESKLYEMRRKEPVTIKGLTTMLANTLNSNRYYPYSVQLLIGGVDKNGPSLYSLDAMGGTIEETKAVSTGSGSPIAYGVLEDNYKEGMTVDEGAELAIRALHNAMKRDSASGDAISVAIISKGTFARMSEEDVAKYRKTLN